MFRELIFKGLEKKSVQKQIEDEEEDKEGGGGGRGWQKMGSDLVGSNISCDFCSLQNSSKFLNYFFSAK